MKLRTAVFACIVIALGGALLTFRFLGPIPQGTPPSPGLIDPGLLEHIAVAFLAGLAVYSIVAALLISACAVDGLRQVRRNLRSSGTSFGECLDLDQWEKAFSGTAVEPLRWRLAQRASVTSDRLTLAAPFSPQTARSEFNRFYFRALGAGQLWSVLLVLLAAGLYASFSGPSSPAARLVPYMSAATAALLLCMVALLWPIMAGGIEALIDTVSALPLRLASESAAAALVPLLTASCTSAAQLPAAVAGAMRSEAQAMLQSLTELSATSLATDSALLERLAENVTRAVFASLDRTLSASLNAFERLATEIHAVGQDLTTRISTLPEIVAQQSLGERAEVMRTVSHAIAADQERLSGIMEGLRQSLIDAIEKQADALRRTVFEGQQASLELSQLVGETSLQIEQDRQKTAKMTTELVASVEAYTAALLPAVKRLESSDERVLKVVGRQDETLSQLIVSLGELSATVDAARMVLANGRGQISHRDAVQDRIGPTQIDEAVGPHVGATGRLASELSALLAEMEESSQSSSR